MLILTRKIGEKIRIGDEVQVLVMAVSQAYVKIGIQAPPHIMVHREEIYRRIQDGKAANSA